MEVHLVQGGASEHLTLRILQASQARLPILRRGGRLDDDILFCKASTQPCQGMEEVSRCDIQATRLSGQGQQEESSRPRYCTSILRLHVYCATLLYGVDRCLYVPFRLAPPTCGRSMTPYSTTYPRLSRTGACGAPPTPTVCDSKDGLTKAVAPSKSTMESCLECKYHQFVARVHVHTMHVPTLLVLYLYTQSQARAHD